MRRTLTVLTGTLVVGWIVFSLYAVARIGGAVVMDPDVTGRIMSVRNVDQVGNVDQVDSSVGLTYHGVPGAVLAVAELLVVSFALVTALFARGLARLAGVAILVIWTGLWLGNSMWLQTRGLDRPQDVALLGAALVVTVVWAALRGRGRRAQPAG